MARNAALVLIAFPFYRHRMEPSREELIEMIAYALWRSLDLRPKKRSLDDARS